MSIKSRLKFEAASLTRAALQAVFNSSAHPPTQDELSEVAGQIVYPPETELGHVAFACHRLSKVYRKAPQAICEALAVQVNEQIKTQSQPGLIQRAQGVGGYLNFSCDLKLLFKFLENPKALPAIHQDQAPSERIAVEFSQPNTHKALHIGHMRNMIYGDAVCNLLAYNGHDVVRSTFPGDMGTHIAKALWYIRRNSCELPTEHQATWLGHKYAEADQFLKDVEGTPTEAIYKSEISEILKDLEAKQGSYYSLYSETRKWSLDEMNAVYNWLGIHFDRWFYESECDESSRHLAQDLYKKGFFVESQGAVGIDLSAYDLGFAVYLKSDGTGLYITKDLELIRRKFEDKTLQKSIVVVDSRQKLHFRQLFKTAELLGLCAPGQSIHLSYESVVDEKGAAFSSRDLNGTSLEELRELICNKVTEEYLAKYRGIWPDAEISTTAHQITLGALKYGMLRYDANRIVKFVLSEWIQLEGETGPYLQYTYARCQSLLEKVERPKNWTLSLEHKMEQELLIFLERFGDNAGLAGREYRPSVLASYLFDLCRMFNRFYKECPIKTAATENERATRLSLVSMVAATIKQGLGLLGIPAPNRL